VLLTTYLSISKKYFFIAPWKCHEKFTTLYARPHGRFFIVIGIRANNIQIPAVSGRRHAYGRRAVYNVYTSSSGVPRAWYTIACTAVLGGCHAVHIIVIYTRVQWNNICVRFIAISAGIAIVETETRAMCVFNVRKIFTTVPADIYIPRARLWYCNECARKTNPFAHNNIM